MQGAARMVLQTGMHPAAIKDSVTSKHILQTYFLRSFTNFKILSQLQEVVRLLDYWLSKMERFDRRLRDVFKLRPCTLVD